MIVYRNATVSLTEFNSCGLSAPVDGLDPISMLGCPLAVVLGRTPAQSASIRDWAIELTCLRFANG